MARFYTTFKLSKRKHLSPEGFLIAEGAALARTGEMIYAAHETPVPAGPDGLVHIIRDEAEVFRPETMASANGKPLVNEHPEDGDVTPDNWRELACGTVLNVRRGTGAESDLLLGDLVITDPEMIKEVQDGKRELSAGYEAEYRQLKPGVGKQLDIIINHVALVRKGRCGPRCSIGDQNTVETEGGRMTRTTKKGVAWADQVRAAFYDQDKGRLEALLGEDGGKEREPSAEKTEDTGAGNAGGGEHHVHIHMPHKGESAPAPVEDDDEPEGEDPGGDEGDTDPVNARLAKIEETLGAMAQAISKLAAAEAEEVEGEVDGDDDDSGDEDGGDDEEDSEDEGDEDETHDSDEGDDDKGGEGDEDDDRPFQEVKTHDADGLASEIADTIALAEILAPGVKIPTFDSVDASLAGKKLCGFRRKALDAACKTKATRELIETVHGGALDTKRMTCDAIAVVFRASAAAKRAANNTAQAPSEINISSGGFALPGFGSNAQLQAEWDRYNSERVEH